jgi:hypothetical protein
MQAKHGDEVVATVSQTMDLLEVGDTKSLANSLHEFWSIKNAYNGSMRWSEHKDLLRQQRFGFVA